MIGYLDSVYFIVVVMVGITMFSAGFALGGGAYLSCCGCGGPHAVWVSEPGAMTDTSVPSDLADELGMLGGTNHRHLELIFQRTQPDANPANAVRCPLL